MKLGRPEVVNGCLLQPLQPHEPWDFELSSASNSITPIFHNQAFNLQCNEFAYSIDHVDDLPKSSADDTTNGDELHVHVGCGRSKDVDDDHHGLTLISLLFECGVAISVDNLVEAHRMLLELTQMTSPYGQSSAERVVTYFAAAMASRVINSILGICSPLLNYKSINNSFQLLNNVTPFIKFAHLASNQTILESLSQCDPIHIIDLDIMQGIQWPPLLQALATKTNTNRSRHVRITAMGTTMELLLDTGKRLSNVARQLGLSFEYNPIAAKVGKVDVSMVKLRRGETVVVNWVRHCLYDATGPDWKTIGLIQQLRPKVFTLVEQDICYGGAFLERFVSSLHYYSAIFDSLGACLSSDDSNRNQVEKNILYREINNILAIGGSSRSGEEKFGEWRSELRKCLIEVPMSTNSMAQAWLMLNMQANNQGFSLVQGEGGTLKLRWKDTSLYTASSWTCSNGAVG